MSDTVHYIVLLLCFPRLVYTVVLVLLYTRPRKNTVDTLTVPLLARKFSYK